MFVVKMLTAKILDIKSETEARGLGDQGWGTPASVCSHPGFVLSSVHTHAGHVDMYVVCPSTGLAMVCIVCPCPNSYVEALTSSVTAFKDGAFGGDQGQRRS